MAVRELLPLVWRTFSEGHVFLGHLFLSATSIDARAVVNSMLLLRHSHLLDTAPRHCS
jgi:hypothetical protein